MKKYLIVIEKQSGKRETYFETDDRDEAERHYIFCVQRMNSAANKRGLPVAMALVKTLLTERRRIQS